MFNEYLFLLSFNKSVFVRDFHPFKTLSLDKEKKSTPKKQRIILRTTLEKIRFNSANATTKDNVICHFSSGKTSKGEKYAFKITTSRQLSNHNARTKFRIPMEISTLLHYFESI